MVAKDKANLALAEIPSLKREGNEFSTFYFIAVALQPTVAKDKANLALTETMQTPISKVTPLLNLQAKQIICK